MDELTKKYAKALTTVVEADREFDEAVTWKTVILNAKKLALVEEDPKAAEWKVNLAAGAQDGPFWKTACDTEADARYALAKAKARLAVIEDAIKRRRAREYGGER